MNNIIGKMKKWIELIQTEELEGLTENIQANIINLNENIDKHIFKLLLYLSHTADKCDKQKYATGNEIYKLTCLLCSTLTEIPDNIKFVSSLFHIVRCLLAMYMYKRASEVCVYLKAEALYSSHADVNSILIKVTYLWYNAVNNMFIILQEEPLNTKYYYELKDVIKFELEMIQMAYKDYTKQLLMKISSYLDKITSVSKESNRCFDDFYIFITKYLDQTNMFLNKDEKYTIFHHALHITSRIMCENINERYLKSAITVLDTISYYFKKILIEDEECYQCFQQFESLCLVLMKPVECLIESSAKSIQDLSDNYVKVAKKYGYKGSVKWTTFSIVQVLEPLFTYWEKCIKTEKKVFLNTDILVGTMNLVARISICFNEQLSNKCKSCQSTECLIKRDVYNAVVIKTRCINLVSKLYANDLSRDICALARGFLEENIACINEMKICKCKCWKYLWSTCGALIYNLGVIMSESHYKESVSLFSLLFTSIIQFEGIQSKSKYINLENPICFTLHRLSILHYNHSMYREAMTASALNALLSYNDVDSKAFRMWANIKHKSVTSKEIMEMTILSCLKIDKIKIEELGFFVDLSQYDLVEICLKEAKGLQEAKVNLSGAIHKILNEMTTLKVTPIQYARVVQMLVYHLQHFDYDEDILECLKQAVSDLKLVKSNNSVLCLQANLEFYIFVTQLHTVNKKTQEEMENSKFALYAPRLSEIGENESRDVVPAYTMINIKEESRLMMYLEAPLKKWNKYLKQNIEEVAKGYEPIITLHTLIIAGEYSHLYRYQECEINIWKLAYKLAFELQDDRAIIYITGRSISLRHINHKWITIAKELAVKLKDTDDENIAYAISTFWISLSDFYFECNMYDEATKLLDKSRKLPGISFFSNKAVYLYSLDRILYNCYLYKEDINHDEYTRYIVETLYTMVNLNEELCARKWKPQDKHLFGFDILLSTTINLSLRMNSLLSFREIGAHLVRRLKTAQTLGATIRVAEILKSLCYIDLSRSQFSDCEVKLQGLEHILNIETFKASMKDNSTKLITENVSATPVRVIDPVRDILQNDASPVLRNKIFELPEFMCHKDCNCYSCQNVSYHYLVFISTHIRAQLYALQKHSAVSLQHFHGAFKMKENLMKTEKCMTKHKSEYVSWQERFYIIDYVLFLLNFSYFLKNYLSTRQEQVINIILLAVQTCNIYNLKGHPIYMSVQEQMLNSRFQKVFDTFDCSRFTVPDSSDIDINKYVQESKVEESICFTPTNNTRAKKPITLRRNRTPPLLKLTKVSMNFSDDEDNNSAPPSGYRRTRSHSKLRRKIVDEEYWDNVSTTKQLQTKSLLKEFTEMTGNNCNISIRDIVNKIALLVPDISEYLYKMVDKIDEPATNKNIQTLTELIEGFKINVTSQRCVRKMRHSKQLTPCDYNKINEVIELFKNLAINKQANKIDRLNEKDLISECKTEFVPSTKSNMDKPDQNNVFLKQCNKGDNLKETYTSEYAKLRVTRVSTKHSVVNKETNYVKTRKSKEKST